MIGSSGPGDSAAEIDPRRADSPGETIDPYAVGSEEQEEADAEEAEFWGAYIRARGIPYGPDVDRNPDLSLIHI